MAGIADSLRRASALVEDFRGDYDQLAAMMRASWGEIPATTYLYTADLLANTFAYPAASWSLAPSIYAGDDLIAFSAGYPRRVLVGGVERRLLISTLLTVAPGYKAAGFGIVVWSELMRRARAAGFDGVVNYCVDRGPMDRMIASGMSMLGLPVVRAASFFYLTRAVPASATATTGGDSPSAADLVRAAGAMPAEIDVQRCWSEPEAAWQLSRTGAVSVKSDTGEDPAVLTAYVISFADLDRTKCLVIDDVLWAGASAMERIDLVRRLLAEGQSRGARTAAMPLLGYTDARPFIEAGFLPSPHTLNAYLTVWSQPPPKPVRGYYLDVI